LKCLDDEIDRFEGNERDKALAEHEYHLLLDQLQLIQSRLNSFEQRRRHESVASLGEQLKLTRVKNELLLLL
jgi:hypothetical protein